MRHPAAIPASALAAGIAAGIFFHPSIPVFVLVAIWLAALIAFLTTREAFTIAGIAIGFAACGAVLGSRADADSRAVLLRRLFEAHVSAEEHQLFGVLTGRLRADAVRGPTGVTLNIAVDRVQLDGVTYSTSGGALVGVGGGLTSDQILQWRAGRQLTFPATLRRPTKYLDPGVGDAERQLAWRGTSLVGSVKSDRLVTVLAPGTRFEELAASARAAVRRAVGSSVAPWSDRSAAIVTAILIGDRAGLDDQVERKLQEAGTYHVIAISGGNIAILAALCLFALRVFWVHTRIGALLVIATLCAYAALVEGGSSVARATLMAAIYFAARFFDHDAAVLNVVAVTAAVLCIAQPLQLVDAGFALTFGATLGIIIGASKLPEALLAPRWLRPAAALLGASVCAEVALFPVSAFVFSRVTFAGLLVNFAAIPLMTVVQIAGMVAVALVWCGSALSVWAGWIAHVATEGLVRSAGVVDVLPWLTRRVPPPPLLLIGIYYLSLAAAIWWRRRSAACVTVVCSVWMVTAPTFMSRTDRLLRVTFVDVGQGDAAVVQFPNGRTLSIDAGGLPGGAFDIGGRVVSPTLWWVGVRRLDYMSVTHGDDDHIGGAESVFRDFQPREVWEGVPVPPHKPSQRLRALADASHTPWRTLLPDDKLSVGEVEVFVRHPPRPDWERQRVRNDDSEVLELRYGGVSFVFTGDIGRDVERHIASSFEPAAIRILKVPHHGSATSSSQVFLDSLRPDIAVISAGRGNTFGHPTPIVLERYRQAGAAIYRTDQDGAISVETDGTTVRVETFTKRRLTLTTFRRTPPT